VGISYDSRATLARFSKKHRIGFPLLADSGSKTIDAYGLRNETATGRYAGIPHPGTILIDAQGVIRAKLRHEGYKKRHEAGEIIAAAEKLP
jgi:peroxiredoxin